MRVLFVAPLSPDAATVRYRCGHLAESLRLSGHQAEVVSADSPIVNVCHEVVVLHRLFWNGAGQRFYRAARAVGSAVVYSVDDLIFTPEYAYHIGLLHPDDPARWRYHRGEVEENRAMLAACDGVLTSTDFLADQVRRVAKTETPVWVVRNFPGAEIGEASLIAAREAQALRDVRRDDRVTLGYLSGSPTHDGDFADLAPTLARILQRFPPVRLLVVGTVSLPGILQPFASEGRIHRHPPVPWRDLPRLLAGVDINLAPLDPTRAFVHAKSEVKFLEAAAVGVPTIAGWAAGFAEGARAGEDCRVPRTSAEWEADLANLIENPAARIQLGNSARAAVANRATPAAQSAHVCRVFEQAAALRPATEKSHVPVTVRRPRKERVIAGLKAAEASLLRMGLRWQRHRRLLRAEVER